MNTQQLIDILFKGVISKEFNQQGNIIYREFCPSSRYKIDFSEGFTKSNWLQFDTDQDAEYFGVWVNPVLMQTLTYAEGDWTLVICEDKESYNREIMAMIAFYEPGYIAKAYTDDLTTVLRQDRNEFFVN